MNIREIMQVAPVIPVLVIKDVDTAVELAQALVDGGLRSLEITLRTDSAFDAIDAIKSSVSDAIVGVGTVNTAKQIQQCIEHKVDFMVSPGLYLPLVELAQASGIPYLPGVSSGSDMLAAVNSGLESLKFFPAVQSGGTAMLKALGGPFNDIQFCPTGGINEKNFHEFLALQNVSCVGGSWVAPGDLIANRDWNAITTLARNSCKK